MVGRTNAASSGAQKETITIKLVTNQGGTYNNELNGVNWIFYYGDSQDNYTWYGIEKTLTVEAGTECRITFESVEGYKTPDAISFTTIAGNSRTIVVTYETQLLTVNITTNGNVFSGSIDVYEYETVGRHTKYTRIEYIESNGTQYVDTLFKPNQDTRVVLDVELMNQLAVCPFAVSSDAGSFSILAVGDGIFYEYGNSSNIINCGSVLDKRIIIDANKNNITCTYPDNSLLGKASLTYNHFDVNENAYIFISNTRGEAIDSYGTQAKLYSCKIYDNDVLVRDYIPAINEYNMPGLYDAVEDKFYIAANSVPVDAGYIVKTFIKNQAVSSSTHKIPYGKRIRLNALDKTGYITPVPIIFDATEPSKTVTINYLKGSVNVWIATRSGKLIDPDHWKFAEAETPIGVALITEKASFIVDGKMYSGKWTTNETYQTALMPGVPAESRSDINNDIYNYYDGVSYTNAMLQYGGTFNNYVGLEISLYADWFNNDDDYKFYFGDRQLTAYVGSTGEWMELSNNYSRVVEVLKMIGMEFRYTNKSNVSTFWTSCQRADEPQRAYACWYYPGDWMVGFANYEKSTHDETNGPCIKMFYKL